MQSHSLEHFIMIYAMLIRCCDFQAVKAKDMEPNFALDPYEGINLSIKDFNQLYENSNIIDDKPYVKRVEIKCSHNGNIHEHGKMLEIEFIVKSPFQINSPAISYQIINSNQQSVLHILNLNSEVPFCQKRGTYVLKSIIPKCTLYPDNYHLKVHFADQTTKNKFETIDEICQFEVKVFSELRDFYWYPSHAVYVEDNHWIIDSIE